MVYDCFTFFNEFDLLEIRLNVLNEVVDKFVLVEMGWTQTKIKKDFLYEKNKDRYKDFSDKIIHIMVDKLPDSKTSAFCNNGNKWQLENYQRDCIMQGLKDAKDDDIILISDVDEIPNPKVILEYKNRHTVGIQVLYQKMMYYFVNNINIVSPVWENGTRIGRFSDLKDPKQDLGKCEFYEFSQKGLPTYFRFCKGEIVKDGGWHFSYCGGVKAIITKRKSICEQQFNTDKNMSEKEILKKIYTGKDILDRKKYFFLALKLDNSFPEYLINNQIKYNHLILHRTFSYIIKIHLYLYLFFIKSYLTKILNFVKRVIKRVLISRS